MLPEAEYDESKLLARITARLLQQTDLLDRLATAMTVLFAAALLLPLGNSLQTTHGYLFTASAGLLLGVLGKWFAIRTRFDAALFEDLATAKGFALDRLDAGLVLAGLIPVARPHSLTERIAGARRLFNCQVVVLGLQVAIILIYRLSTHA